MFLRFVAIFIFLTLSSYAMPKSEPNSSQSLELETDDSLCPKTPDTCIFKQNGPPGEKLICLSSIDRYHYEDVKDLTLCSYNNTTLYLKNIIRSVPNVRNITILNSTFSFLLGTSNINNFLTELRIRGTTLKRIADNLLTNLPNLAVLDLRGNLLSRLPLHMHHEKLKAIFLSKNNWNCSGDTLSWANNLDKDIVKDLEQADCAKGSLHGDKPVFKVAQFFQDMQLGCPDICVCSMMNVIRDLNNKDSLHPIVDVNCTGRNLFVLPQILPNYTKILHLEHNFINDLSPIITNRYYRNLLDLFLDYNQVSSIAILEGGHWLEKFRVLSLKGNQLSQLPVYALDHALEQNPNMPHAIALFLADNPWRCDCAYTPYFQEMLMKYVQQIRDVDLVKCRYLQGDANSLLPILSLTRNAFCRFESENALNPLDLLNAILATLIILILGKLAYDYYNFKRTGQLPWIVTKIP